MLNIVLKQNHVIKDDDQILEQEYASRGELHYALRLSYWRMSQAIKEGRLALHLIDNKIKLNVQDVIDLFVAQ